MPIIVGPILRMGRCGPVGNWTLHFPKEEFGECRSDIGRFSLTEQLFLEGSPKGPEDV